MLINSIPAGAKKSIAEKVRFRIFLGAAAMVLGIISIAFSLVFSDSLLSDFFSGFYIGTGSGIIAAALVVIINNIRLLKNKEKLKKQEIEENDERNRFIISKTASISFFVSLYSLYAALLVAGIFNTVAFYTLLACAAFMMLMTSIVYLIVRKIY